MTVIRAIGLVFDKMRKEPGHRPIEVIWPELAGAGPLARLDQGWGVPMHEPVQEFTLEHVSTTLTNGKTKAHINCGCREGDIRLAMSRLVLERLRLTINRALERMPSAVDDSD